MNTGSMSATNITFTTGGFSCATYSFLIAGRSALRINIPGKNLTHRQAKNRYLSF